jgi:hypothetical protein
MARCNECYSVLTARDSACYICGLPSPDAKKSFLGRKKEPKPAPQITPVSNLLFIASLILTGVSFFAGEKMSLTVSASLSGILFAARLLNDRLTNKKSALSPVAVPRLNN